MRQPPAYMELADGGFITLYIDNLIAVGKPDTIKKLRDRWMGVGKKMGTFMKNRVSLKEWEMKTPREWSRSPVEYLGVEITRKQVKLESGEVVYQTQWRQLPRKIEKWRPHFERLLSSKMVSFRDVAKCCGRLLWRQCLSRVCLADFHDVIRIIKRMAKERSNKHWDVKMELTKEELEVINKHFEDMKTNAFIKSSCEDVARTTTFACSDSSGQGWGYVIFDDEWGIPPDGQYGEIWEESLRSCHIFIKELIAAKRTVIRCMQRASGPIHLILGVDNSAAAQVLRNKYSSNDFVIPHIRELCSEMEKSQCTLQVINLRSKDNASDGPSRGRRATEDEMRRCSIEMARSQLINGAHGIRENEYDGTNAPSPGLYGTKHEEKGDDLESAFVDFILSV